MGEKILYSQTLLHQAMLLLLKKKPLEKITIQELCKTAGVNRTTFYNHYERPEEILRELVQQFSASFSSQIAPDSTSPVDCLTHLLETMEENLLLTRRLSQAFSGCYLFECIMSQPMIRTQLLSSFSDFSEPSAVISFLTAGSAQLVKDWLFCDTRCSAREEAEIILSLCRKICS